MLGNFRTGNRVSASCLTQSRKANLKGTGSRRAKPASKMFGSEMRHADYSARLAESSFPIFGFQLSDGDSMHHGAASSASIQFGTVS
jgi:hypothetical protein